MIFMCAYIVMFISIIVEPMLTSSHIGMIAVGLIITTIALAAVVAVGIGTYIIWPLQEKRLGK